MGKNPKLNTISVGGASLLLANFIGYISNYFEIGTSENTNVFILVISAVIILAFREYMSMKCKNKLEKDMNLKELPKRSLYLFPTSPKHILFTLAAFSWFVIFANGIRFS